MNAAVRESRIVDPNGRRIVVVNEAFQAGGNNRRTRGMPRTSAGPNTAAVGTQSNLRTRSRAQYNNNPYAQSSINKLVSNIIGTGIKPLSMASDKAVRKAVKQIWTDFVASSDPDGSLDFYGQQAQMTNAWLQGGEAFARFRFRRNSDGLPVPLQLQTMEPELCPAHYHAQVANRNVKYGIELNRIGQRAAYWMYPDHPGDHGHTASLNSTGLRRVQANQVIHLFDPVRPGQMRGTVKIASALQRLHDVGIWDDATLLRQQLANLFTAFVQRDEEDEDEATDPLTGQPIESDDSLPEVGLEPGITRELAANESVTFSDPPDAGASYSDYLWRQLIGVGAGFEVPYEIMTSDYSKINDRTARVLMNDFRRRVQQFQHLIVIHQMCSRVWRTVLDTAVVSGRIKLRDYAEKRNDYAAVKWVPQGWEYINPVQDVAAEKEAIKGGLKSRSGSVAGRGADAAEVDAEYQEDNERQTMLGLVYDTDLRQQAGADNKQLQQILEDDLKTEEDKEERELMRQALSFLKDE